MSRREKGREDSGKGSLLLPFGEMRQARRVGAVWGTRRRRRGPGRATEPGGSAAQAADDGGELVRARAKQRRGENPKGAGGRSTPEGEKRERESSLSRLGPRACSARAEGGRRTTGGDMG